MSRAGIAGISVTDPDNEELELGKAVLGSLDSCAEWALKSLLCFVTDSLYVILILALQAERLKDPSCVETWRGARVSQQRDTQAAVAEDGRGWSLAAGESNYNKDQ